MVQLFSGLLPTPVTRLALPTVAVPTPPMDKNDYELRTAWETKHIPSRSKPGFIIRSDDFEQKKKGELNADSKLNKWWQGGSCCCYARLKRFTEDEYRRLRECIIRLVHSNETLMSFRRAHELIIYFYWYE